MKTRREKQNEYIKRYYKSHPGYHYKLNKGWRKRNKIAWNYWKYKYYKKHSRGATRGYRRWSLEEEDLVLKHSILDVLLARRLKRTLKAIHVRRAYLKR